MSTRKPTIKFTRAPAQAELIRRCVARADAMYRAAGGAPDKIGLEMDLSAVNANGCPIDFERLLAFDDGSFLHDIAGIQNAINRRTGHLTGCFVPRSARGARP